MLWCQSLNALMILLLTSTSGTWSPSAFYLLFSKWYLKCYSHVGFLFAVAALIFFGLIRPQRLFRSHCSVVEVELRGLTLGWVACLGVMALCNKLVKCDCFGLSSYVIWAILSPWKYSQSPPDLIKCHYFKYKLQLAATTSGLFHLASKWFVWAKVIL